MSLNHFLHVLSASLNLVIISITGSKFRKTLMDSLRFKADDETTVARPKCKFSSTRVKESFEMRNIEINASFISYQEQSSKQQFMLY